MYMYVYPRAPRFRKPRVQQRVFQLPTHRANARIVRPLRYRSLAPRGISSERGTHRLGALGDECVAGGRFGHLCERSLLSVCAGVVRLGVWGVVLVVCMCVSVSGVLLSVGVCVCVCVCVCV